jgi:hypothetical protein
VWHSSQFNRARIITFRGENEIMIKELAKGREECRDASRIFAAAILVKNNARNVRRVSPVGIDFVTNVVVVTRFR